MKVMVIIERTRCPDPPPGEDAEREIRSMFEPSDLGPELTPERRAQRETP